MASLIPNKVEYDVATIGQRLRHLNAMSSIALYRLAAVLVDKTIGASSRFTTLLKFFFVFLPVHSNMWSDFLFLDLQQGQLNDVGFLYISLHG